VLFNGTHVNANGDGQYARVRLKKDKRHPLRIINTSVDNAFQVSLVNHQFTVVATDLMPVNAFTTSGLFVAVGQRYDVTIDASQDAGNCYGRCDCRLISRILPAGVYQ
jgi:FtsP/CotA-like multicopper oxidase with cupredoxin domain